MIKLYDFARDETERKLAEKVNGMDIEHRERYLEAQANHLLYIDRFSGDRTLKRISRE